MIKTHHPRVTFAGQECCRLPVHLFHANAFVYVQAGAVSIGERDISFGRMVILDNDPESQGVVIRNESDETARVLLIAGAPLGERIVQYGPFVMNSEQEIYQAISDYRNGKLVA